MSCRISPGSWPIGRPPSRSRWSVQAPAAPPSGCGRGRRRASAAGDRRVDDRHDQCGQPGRASALASAAIRQAVNAPRASSATTAAPINRPAPAPSCLPFSRQLGLGELDLLADERAGLLRQVLQQLARRALAQVGAVRRRHQSHHPGPHGSVVQRPAPGGRTGSADRSGSAAWPTADGRAPPLQSGRRRVTPRSGGRSTPSGSAKRRTRAQGRRPRPPRACCGRSPRRRAAAGRRRTGAGSRRSARTRSAAFSASSAGLSLPWPRSSTATLRTSSAVVRSCSPACVERVSTSAASRFFACPAASDALSFAWPAASRAFSLAPPPSVGVDWYVSAISFSLVARSRVPLLGRSGPHDYREEALPKPRTGQN